MRMDQITRQTLALSIHRRWCTDRLCSDVTADDWHEADNVIATEAWRQREVREPRLARGA